MRGLFAFGFMIDLRIRGSETCLRLVNGFPARNIIRDREREESLVVCLMAAPLSRMSSKLGMGSLACFGAELGVP